MPRTPQQPSILQVCAVDFTARHFLLPLMRAQRAAGFKVSLACSPSSYAAQLQVEGFQVYPIPFHRSMNVLAHGRAYLKLASLLRRRPFTVVHAHTPIAAMIARVAARRAGVPLVLYTAHGFYFHEAMAPRTYALHVGLERFCQRYADYLFTQSAEDAQTAIRERISPEERTLAIGNGVDTARFAREAHRPADLAALREELGLQPPPPVGENPAPLVIMIGRLVREKGYFEFLQAMAALRRRVPGARALVVGDALPSDHDDSAAQIRAEARRLGLEEPGGAPAVIFAGLRGDVPRLLQLGDIFCLPSWREGMPRSLIEAMAAGLPVVATNIRGCREEVVDGQTGYLVPVRDPAALGEALGRLASEGALRRRMGDAGQRRAREFFDEAIVIDRQMKVLRQLYREKQLDWPSA